MRGNRHLTLTDASGPGASEQGGWRGEGRAAPRSLGLRGGGLDPPPSILLTPHSLPSFPVSLPHTPLPFALPFSRHPRCDRAGQAVIATPQQADTATPRQAAAATPRQAATAMLLRAAIATPRQAATATHRQVVLLLLDKLRSLFLEKVFRAASNKSVWPNTLNPKP
jgi:hypothetical protein